MRGYYEKPEATAAAIDADGWLHTGDMGLLRADGHLRFMGRYKDMLKIGGENVDPMEVEAFLMAHPAVNLVAVVGFPDARLSEVGVAFVRLEPGQTLTEDDVLAHCRGRIASFKIPRRVIFVDDFPMTSSGKIQKVKLRAEALVFCRRPESRQGRFPWMWRPGAPWPRDEACASLEGEIGPRPVDEDHEAIPELDQVEDVHEEPGEPRDATGQPHGTDLSDGRGAADGGHLALVAIVEGPRGRAADAPPGIVGGQAALLHGHRRHAGQRRSGLMGERAEVSDHEDIGMAGHREIRLDRHAAGAVQRDAEGSGQGDASTPAAQSTVRQRI